MYSRGGLLLELLPLLDDSIQRGTLCLHTILQYDNIFDGLLQSVGEWCLLSEIALSTAAQR